MVMKERCKNNSFVFLRKYFILTSPSEAICEQKGRQKKDEYENIFILFSIMYVGDVNAKYE